jgi:large conductance mechanosensitive channel
MSPFFAEFKKFILRGNVVDLAVGIVIGTAFGKIVDSLVKDVFMSLISVATGGFDVSKQALHLGGEANLAWGAFLQAVINFVIIGFCMFLVVKGVNALHKYMLKDEGVPVVEPTPTEKLLGEIRDLLKQNAAPSPPAAAVPPAPPQA